MDCLNNFRNKIKKLLSRNIHQKNSVWTNIQRRKEQFKALSMSQKRYIIRKYLELRELEVDKVDKGKKDYEEEMLGHPWMA